MHYRLAPVLLLLPALMPAAEPRWPQFRGTTGGVSAATGLPVVWDTKTNVAWQAEVPGCGWSSPIVWGDRVFLTTVVSEGKTEPFRKGLYFGGERRTPPSDVHRWLVIYLDARTGKALWQREVHRGVPSSPVHIKNSYASETPVTDGERVYAYFGNVGVFCCDFEGKELWSKKWDTVRTRFNWGTAASPALFKDRLFIVNDNEEKSFLVALDARTGKELWRVERDEKSNWATPFVWENEKRTELVTCGSNRIRSYDLDGKPLWEMGGMSSIAIPTPLTRHGLLYVSSGYVLGNPKPVYAIRPGASGDISLADGQDSSAFVAWSQKKAGPYNPSPIVYGDYLYVLYDRGMMACYDARTGKEVYGPERLGPGATAFTASPWAADGKIFCLSEDGDTFVIQAGPQFRVLGRNRLDETCLATPAPTAHGLIVRTLSKVYCLREKP
jgi:outer membrane protein assembly factor BamB